MTKDKSLEDVFLSHHIEIDDKDEFMAKLDQRLDTVEYLHQHEEATIRQYKYALIIAFVVGLASGCALLAFVLSAPLDMPIFTFDATSTILLLIERYSRMITIAALSLLLGVGVVKVIDEFTEIIQMRTLLNMSGIEKY